MLKKRALSRSRESMTLPDERYRSIMQAKRLLEELMDPKLTPRVAAGIRDRARGALRHYPSEYELKQLEQFAPHIVQQQMEPLYKMIKQHEMAESVAKDYAAEGMIKQHDSAAGRLNLDDPDWEPHT
jgi:predicted component of type VI protein secretion system